MLLLAVDLITPFPPPFRALFFSLPQCMHMFQAGGEKERDEVIAILHSLKADVQSSST